VLLCITIIGIPFGVQSFEFVPLALFPFGKEIVSANDLRDDIGIARASASTPSSIDPAACSANRPTAGDARCPTNRCGQARTLRPWPR